ncbi:MAG: hypothetical protein H6741_28185 [Alphaproteobacteria bacterium]|nr:hypothetical protein [Alphaproteobacteria bacterium]MCB9796595.1 hypothetical protein [Alphaproteobacteria bacterium]
MKWDLVGNVRCDIYAYTAPNLCGNRQHVAIFPSGVKGEFDGERIASCIISAPVGTQVTFYTATSEVGRATMPWRAFRILQGQTVKTKEGRPAVRVLDLDLMNAPTDHRLPEDFAVSYPHVDSADEGEGWTFGNRGNLEIKNRVRCIRIEKLP